MKILKKVKIDVILKKKIKNSNITCQNKFKNNIFRIIQIINHIFWYYDFARKNDSAIKNIEKKERYERGKR